MNVPKVRAGIMESHYWAAFRKRSGGRLRFDTRIYLTPRIAPAECDVPIGCIVGKNPGSAIPPASSRRLQPLVLSGDRFLPNVLAILRKAYNAASREPPVDAYLQVLNLFYLCDRNLQQAKNALRVDPRRMICKTERTAYPWAWLAWGGSDPLLDPLKARFRDLSAQKCFFYDGREGCVRDGMPRNGELARHTQGMPHGALVAHIATLLAGDV